VLAERRVEFQGRKLSRRALIAVVRAAAVQDAQAKPIPEAEPVPEAVAEPKGEVGAVGSTQSQSQRQPPSQKQNHRLGKSRRQAPSQRHSHRQSHRQGKSHRQGQPSALRTRDRGAAQPSERAEARAEKRHLAALVEADRSPVRTNTGMHVAVARMWGTPRPQAPAQASAAICRGRGSLLSG